MGDHERPGPTDRVRPGDGEDDASFWLRALFEPDQEGSLFAAQADRAEVGKPGDGS